MYSSRKAFSLLLCILGFAYGLQTQAHRLGNGYPRNSEGTPKNAAFIPAPSHITQNNTTAGVRMSHAIRAKGAGSGEVSCVMLCPSMCVRDIPHRFLHTRRIPTILLHFMTLDTLHGCWIECVCTGLMVVWKYIESIVLWQSECIAVRRAP